METIKNKNLVQFKYLVLIALISFISCSFDECGSTGYTPPPPPVIDVSNVLSGTKAKFYFNSNERLTLKSIEVEMTKDNSIYRDYIIFRYPYLICKASETHIIKEYANAQNGQMWTFTFNGVSLTTGINFSVTSSCYITQ
jgi:hypothetical protein